jgi:hypothetical protein
MLLWIVFRNAVAVKDTHSLLTFYCDSFVCVSLCLSLGIDPSTLANIEKVSSLVVRANSICFVFERYQFHRVRECANDELAERTQRTGDLGPSDQLPYHDQFMRVDRRACEYPGSGPEPRYKAVETADMVKLLDIARGLAGCSWACRHRRLSYILLGCSGNRRANL